MRVTDGVSKGVPRLISIVREEHGFLSSNAIVAISSLNERETLLAGEQKNFNKRVLTTR